MGFLRDRANKSNRSCLRRCFRDLARKRLEILAMITYSQMRSWRDICEYLNTCWYKFANESDIRKNCPKALRNLYLPKGRSHRKHLYNEYLIQFVVWQQHPITFFKKSACKKYEKEWGWRLTNDWEYKIDYLEHLVLFNKEPEFKHWESALKQRLYLRKEREKKKRLEEKLRSLPELERKIFAAKSNICWRCFSPIAMLMVDCINCGANQGDT